MSTAGRIDTYNMTVTRLAKGHVINSKADLSDMVIEPVGAEVRPARLRLLVGPLDRLEAAEAALQRMSKVHEDWQVRNTAYRTS